MEWRKPACFPARGRSMAEDLSMCDLCPATENVVVQLKLSGHGPHGRAQGGPIGELRGGPWARRTRRRQAPGTFDKSERPIPIRMP